MAYNKEELEKNALSAIKKNKLKFITHVVAYLPCTEKTLFNQELQELQSIKEAIEANRINAKVRSLNRWEESENATLQIAFYKLIADDEEADRLNGTRQKVDLTSNGKEVLTGIKVEIIK